MSFAHVVVAVAVAMFCYELFMPRHAWPEVVGWWTRAFFLNAIGYLSVYVYGATMSDWIIANRLWYAEEIGVLGGHCLVILCYPS